MGLLMGWFGSLPRFEGTFFKFIKFILKMMVKSLGVFQGLKDLLNLSNHLQDDGAVFGSKV